MIQKHRISTNIGRDQKINVEIKQDFDIMEILSLKFSQKDIYSSGNCSEYGVVVGRVSANSGFGIPNAKISIFVPLSDLDIDDPVISKLYPYQTLSDKDDEGYRYNLLPSRQQHGGHSPTGTFMDQQDILTREECLEVFESYYSYTVKTNSSGDFMIWGVPIGTQTIHVDVDLSDIGCFSLRPYDFIRKGEGEDKFERLYKFKSSVDIDGLPQIISFDRSVQVYPFWGNEELCEIGITRTDFDLLERGIKIEPISLILMSSVTDDTADAVKKNGRIRRNSGYKCNLQTTGGKIECVRQTGRTVLSRDGTTRYPELEYFNLTEVIDDTGVAMVVLPMNMEYTYTNEFGEEEITNDSNKGIPTTTIARFRFSLDFNNRKHAVAKYLVPNIREFNPNPFGTTEWYRDDDKHIISWEYMESMLASYQFSDVFEEYISVTQPTGLTLNSDGYDIYSKIRKRDFMLGTNNNGIPEDYFYKFIYGKVYTVSSFQGTHSETEIPLLTDGNRRVRDAFLGIKQIRPNVEEDCASKTNYIPTNYGFKNRVKFNLLLNQVLLFIQYVYSIIFIRFAEMLGRFFYGLSKLLYNIGIRRWRPFRKISQQFEDRAYEIQDKYTVQLPLTIYPDCEECTNDDESVILDASFVDDYCRVAEFRMKVDRFHRAFGPSAGGTCEYSDKDTVSIWGYHSDYRNQTTDESFLSIWSGLSENYLFPGEMAKDNDGLCSGSTVLNYYSLSGLTSQVIIPTPPDETTARYVAVVYPYIGGGVWAVSGTSLFSEFVIFFDNDPLGDGSSAHTHFHRTGIPPKSGCREDLTDAWMLSRWDRIGAHTFSYDEWNELCGMDFNNLPANAEEQTYAIVRIYDRALMKVSSTGTTITDIEMESGCAKYDKTYNENIAFGYIWASGTTYGALIKPSDPSGIPGSNFSTYWDAPGFREYLVGQTPPYPYINLQSTIIGNSTTLRMPYKKAYTKIPNAKYQRKTKSGLSEFRNGVFTLIPVIRGTTYNLTALQEWYRRKRVGTSFCGGVVNFSFIDNWLNGLLYFFKFEKRIKWDNESALDLNVRRSKYPRSLIFFNVIDGNFYYRSCPYNLYGFNGQYNYDTGVKEILHPTTFYDVGVRDEFLYEICTDPKVDPTCSVIRDITPTSYQDPANIVEYAINYRLDITDAKFDVDDFFSGENFKNTRKTFDGDITQLMSINCEAGIEAFDLDTPHYFMYNGELMDPEDSYFDAFFKSGNNFGPVPIDLKLDYNGGFIRSCLNSRLGDYSQVVPFYLWNKGDSGFGPYGNASDKQTWDRTSIASMKLQRLYSISGITDTNTNYIMADGEEEYLLKPMTITHPTYSIVGATEDMLERFEVISYSDPPTCVNCAINYIEGDLWLEVLSGSLSDPQSGNIYVVVNKTWTIQSDQYFDGFRETFIPQTITNYRGQKQVLSTPFLFYFGLRPEKTALDLLIKYFGPKGAFLTTETFVCPDAGVTPTPTPTPAATLLPIPTPPASRGVTPTPTPSVMIGLSIAPSSWELPSTGGDYLPTVTTDGSIIWNASTSEEWVNLTNNTNRVGTTTFTISASSNAGVGNEARGTIENITVQPTTPTTPTHVHFTMYQRFFSTTTSGMGPWPWNSNEPTESATLNSSNYDNISLTAVPDGFWVYDGNDNPLYEGYMINEFAPGGIIKVKPSSNNNPSGASGNIVLTDSDGATINIWVVQSPATVVYPSIINGTGDPNYNLSGSGYAGVGTYQLNLSTISQYYNPSPPPTIFDCDLLVTLEIEHNAYPVQTEYVTWHSTPEGETDNSVITLDNIVGSVSDSIIVTVTAASPPY